MRTLYIKEMRIHFFIVLSKRQVSVYLSQRISIFHFTLHHEEHIIGFIRAHTVIRSFFDYVIHDFILIDVNVSFRIRLYIQTTTGGVIVNNHVEDVIQIIIRELVLQFLRQIVFDKFYRFASSSSSNKKSSSIPIVVYIKGVNILFITVKLLFFLPAELWSLHLQSYLSLHRP